MFMAARRIIIECVDDEPEPSNVGGWLAFGVFALLCVAVWLGV